MKKILIIDDDKEFVNAVKTLLEANGYQVNFAYNTKEGSRQLEKSKPDLILLDVMMEQMDEGFQFSYKLRNNKEFKDIPIIMITGVSEKSGFKFSPDRDNVDGTWIPVDDFIEKPVQSSVLLEKIKKILGE